MSGNGTELDIDETLAGWVLMLVLAVGTPRFHNEVRLMCIDLLNNFPTIDAIEGIIDILDCFPIDPLPELASEQK